MCGRFAQTTELSILISRFRFIIEDLELRKSYNIAPSQDTGVVIVENQSRRLKMHRWGLIPFWAKEKPKGTSRINTRVESLCEKTGFRHMLENKRCLVLADGYYEWQKIPGTSVKTPFFISLKDQTPFGFAGLWDVWKDAEEKIVMETFSIITTRANALTFSIHERMPVILSPESEDVWLDPEQKDPEKLIEILKPYPSEEMEAYEVSPYVNYPKNDSPECIRRISSGKQGDFFV